MTTTLDVIEVFNRRSYRPCRHCGHAFARGSGCLCMGVWMVACPACGAPVAEPDNAETGAGVPAKGERR